MPPGGFLLLESHTTPLAGVCVNAFFPHNQTYGLASAGWVGLTFVSCYPAIPDTRVNAFKKKKKTTQGPSFLCPT
jgi:hypothetical protein